MKYNNKVLDIIGDILKTKISIDKQKKVIDYASKRYNGLKEENKKDCDALKKHTETQIFPGIALYEGLINNGVKKEKALEILDECFKTKAEKPAKMIRNILKLPGLYKLMPKIFIKAVKKKFGEDAGFKTKFYDKGKCRAKFDMIKCPYFTVCKKYGYPELTKCFCHTDDVAYGNMHKKLLWKRTKTIGQGADICDFDLELKK